jgi:CheY-like chemotaxis protein
MESPVCLIETLHYVDDHLIQSDALSFPFDPGHRTKSSGFLAEHHDPLSDPWTKGSNRADHRTPWSHGLPTVLIARWFAHLAKRTPLSASDRIWVESQVGQGSTFAFTTATRRIKADPALQSIPIIAVTSYALDGEEKTARAAGCDDYVPKPFSPRHSSQKSGSTCPRPPFILLQCSCPLSAQSGLDKQADPNRSKDRIHPQAVARTVSDLAKKDGVFVFDTGLNTLWSANWLRQTGSQRIIGPFNNAAVGTALAQANGIQALDRSRQVIALCGDGGFNMLMSEFLTAVHHKLPVKAVVYKNSAFGLITLEAESIGLPAYREGIEFPNPDYVALANAKIDATTKAIPISEIIS